MRFKSIKILGISVALLVAISLSACSSGAKIPSEYKYDLSKYVELGKWEGIKFTKNTSEVSEDDIQNYIKSALEQAKKIEYVESGTIAEDSTVKLDYTGKLNGKEFEGGTAKNVELNIANNSFIKGFASALVGHKIGETFDINVTFPADYTAKKLAGKDAVFTIKAKALVATKIPEFNDDFVKANSKFKNTKEYTDNVRSIIKKDRDLQANSKDKQKVFQKIVADTKIKKYPDKELKEETKNKIEMFKASAKSSGMKYEDYVKAMGSSIKDFEAQAEEQAKDTVKQKLIIYALADKVGVKVDQSEYDKALEKMLKNAGYTKKSYKQASGQSIEEYANKNNLYIGVLYDKTMDKVMKKAIAE